MTGRKHRRALRLFGAAILAGALTALLAGPAAATFKGRDGRIATAWLDDDQGAHEEAAYAVLTLPWRTGSAGRNLHSCTALDGCAEYSDPAYSADGKRIVYTRSPDVTGNGGKSELVMENAGGGSPATISSSTQNLFEASFYPSGRRLVFVRSPSSSPEIEVDPGGRIVTSNLTGGDTRVLTGDGSAEPAVSPNGRAVIYVRGEAIWIVRINGGHPRRLIADAEMPQWSPSGRSIVYVAGNYPHGHHVLSVARSDGSRRHRLIGAYPGGHSGSLTDVDYPVFSPDGKQIAFSTSSFDGSGDPYVFRLPATGGRARMLWTTGLLDAGGTDLGVAWQPLR